MKEQDKAEFATVYSKAINDGWRSALKGGDIPCETTLQKWLEEGNAPDALVRPRIKGEEELKEHLHLLRGTVEWATLAYGDPVYSCGEWNAWLKEPD